MFFFFFCAIIINIYALIYSIHICFCHLISIYIYIYLFTVSHLFYLGDIHVQETGKPLKKPRTTGDLCIFFICAIILIIYALIYSIHICFCIVYII